MPHDAARARPPTDRNARVVLNPEVLAKSEAPNPEVRAPGPTPAWLWAPYAHLGRLEAAPSPPRGCPERPLILKPEVGSQQPGSEEVNKTATDQISGCPKASKIPLLKCPKRARGGTHMHGRTQACAILKSAARRTCGTVNEGRKRGAQSLVTPGSPMGVRRGPSNPRFLRCLPVLVKCER